MIKVRDLPIITIHLQGENKLALRKMAERRGMKVTTLCRSILLKAIEDEEAKK